MSKMLRRLFERAEYAETANINGRLDGVFRSKYEIHFSDSELELIHWGTTILKMSSPRGQPSIQDFYGQSKSDRDAISFIFNQLGLDDWSVSYRPSVDKFSIYGDFGSGSLETRIYGEDYGDE